MYKQPWFWALCVAIVAVGSVIAINVGTHPSRAKHTVVYSITGTVQKPTIYYYDSSESAQQVKDQSLPWSKTLTVTGDPTQFRAGAFVKGNSEHGELACSIRIDGKISVTKKTTATDPQVRCVPSK